MGKCVRIRSSRSSNPSPLPVEAAAYLTLRSGRRVPVAAAACSPPAGRRHRRGSPTSCRCGGASKAAAAANKRTCGNPGRRKSPAVLASRPGDEELPTSQANPVAGDDRRGGSFEPAANTPPLSGEVVKLENEHGSKKGGVEGRAAPSPLPMLEAEMEAFFAAAELAERRRFAEAYNYDIALDRPLEGRFEWAPVST